MFDYMANEEIITTMTTEELDAIMTDALIDGYWEREADVLMAQYDYPEDF